MHTEEQEAEWNALTPEERRSTIAYKQWLPFAQLWETRGLPVDLIGIRLAERGMFDYQGDESELRQWFLRLIELRNEFKKELKAARRNGN